MSREIDLKIANKFFAIEIEELNESHNWCVDYRAKDEAFNDALMSNQGLEGWRLKKFSEDENSCRLVRCKLASENINYCERAYKLGGQIVFEAEVRPTKTNPMTVVVTSLESPAMALCLAALQARTN